ncbi:MAG TPA: helix-hairpin-helix domain-containing protein [Puia sp.]|nr:helix-hairpin-helix domain-containing protein [Puia sp.]
MRESLLVFLFMIICMIVDAQINETTNNRSSQLEAVTEKKDSEPEDDSYELDLEYFRRHPLNLNTAAEEDLIHLQILEVLQVKNFISYRKLLGPLLSVYELQSVPGWDIGTIRKLLPYIMIGQNESVYSALKERWKGGDEAVLIRAAQVIEKAKGFIKPDKPGNSYYEGSAQKIFIRYTYNYKQLLAFGFTGDKDAGEPFFRSAQRYGFDFYSFHFFLRHTGVIRALAIGDFTVNMGQGLIQWQTIALTKSSQVLSIKREADFLRPYHSAGEFNFHRGLGITLQKGNWQSSLFISAQKISTNLVPDTTGKEDLFSSFQNSGYHRTPAEIADRNNSRQLSAGANIRYSTNRFLIGFNWVQFHFDRPFQKRNEPYNLNSLKGKSLSDFSLDYNYTIRNLHLFGELATDHGFRIAFVQGALISLGENIDMSFLYRNISPSFRSLYSDAFTENSVPNNEKGFYAGLSFKPTAGLQAAMYYDLFVFPWLKYRVDGPSWGRDFLLQVSWQPDKFWRFSSLYKNEMKMANAVPVNERTHGLVEPLKKRWRIETDYMISRSFSFFSRMEFVWIDISGTKPRRGFLGTAGFEFRKSRLSGNISTTIFDTQDYDTRIYIYEPDLLYNFSLPAYFGRGIHYYLNIRRDFSRLIPHAGKHFKLYGWLKWSQTFYPESVSIGSGLDEIAGNRKSELKAQVMIEWQ